MADLRDYLARHGIVSLFVLLMVFGLVAFATCRVFMNMDAVSAAVATCYTALIGLPAAAIGFARWRFSKDGDDK